MESKAPKAVWVSMRDQRPRNYFPCHVENASFDDALIVFDAKSTRLRPTSGAPQTGCHFMLSLPTSRYALITNYDDFPQSVEISLELRDEGEIGEAKAYLEDLWLVLEPLGLPMPDKSNIGFPQWV